MKARCWCPRRSRTLEKFFHNRKLLITTLPLPDQSLIISSDKTLYRWYGNGRIDSLQIAAPVAALYYQPGNDRIWIGGRFGLFHSDLDLNPPIHIEAFKKTIVRHVSEDRQGRILVGTDKGIFRQQGDTFIRIPTAQPNAPCYVNTVYTDAYGKIWVGTNDGLCTSRERHRKAGKPTAGPGAMQYYPG